MTQEDTFLMQLSNGFKKRYKTDITKHFTVSYIVLCTPAQAWVRGWGGGGGGRKALKMLSNGDEPSVHLKKLAAMVYHSHLVTLITLKFLMLCHQVVFIFPQCIL